MNKKNIYFTLIFLFLSFNSSCNCSLFPEKNPVHEGTYYSFDEKIEAPFSHAKFTIEEITKEEYELADGINVFIDDSTFYNENEEEKRYLSIEFYLYVNELERYELVILKNLEPEKAQVHHYTGTVDLIVNDKVYFDNDNVGFIFDVYYKGDSMKTSIVKLYFNNNRVFDSFFQLYE